MNQFALFHLIEILQHHTKGNNNSSNAIHLHLLCWCLKLSEGKEKDQKKDAKSSEKPSSGKSDADKAKKETSAAQDSKGKKEPDSKDSKPSTKK